MGGKGSGIDKEYLGQYSLPREEYIANCRKGGIRGQQTLKRKRELKELANAILELKLDDEAMRARLIELGFEGDITQAAGILFAQARKATSGDTEAARFVRDTAGQRPVDGLAIGNLNDKPFETIDLTSLSNEELMQLIAAREEE